MYGTLNSRRILSAHKRTKGNIMHGLNVIIAQNAEAEARHDSGNAKPEMSRSQKAVDALNCLNSRIKEMEHLRETFPEVHKPENKTFFQNWKC